MLIAYIGQKDQRNRMNVGLLLIATQKGKQKVPIKEKNSIYTYRVRKEKRVNM